EAPELHVMSGHTGLHELLALGAVDHVENHPQRVAADTAAVGDQLLAELRLELVQGLVVGREHPNLERRTVGDRSLPARDRSLFTGGGDHLWRPELDRDRIERRVASI